MKMIDMFTKGGEDEFAKLTKKFVEEEVKPYKEKIEELNEEIGELQEEVEELQSELEDLNDELERAQSNECGVDGLLQYIDELEKEVYIYQNKNLDAKAIIDELIYKVQCIRG